MLSKAKSLTAEIASEYASQITSFLIGVTNQSPREQKGSYDEHRSRLQQTLESSPIEDSITEDILAKFDHDLISYLNKMGSNKSVIGYIQTSEFRSEK